MSAAPALTQAEFWNGDVGSRWVAQQERLDHMLAGVSAALFAAAGIKSGERVLDIGCGCGETSLRAAALGAEVMGADISEPMLARAKMRAADVTPRPTFALADASRYAFEAAHVDLLMSRFGVMFFDDPTTAFANMRKALKPSGRIAFACWRDPKENEWVRVPVGAARANVPPQPPVNPEDPGPFSLANPLRLRSVLANAGFDAITLKPVDLKLEMGTSLDDTVAYLQEFGPVSRLLAGAGDADRMRAVAAIREALTPFARTTPVMLGAAIWIVQARI